MESNEERLKRLDDLAKTKGLRVTEPNRIESRTPYEVWDDTLYPKSFDFLSEVEEYLNKYQN